MAPPGPVESAVSNFVDSGLFPDDDELVTAELPSKTLISLSDLLDKARSDVKTSIRELSRLSAPDIDGWISQAKQLKGDVDDSVKQADIITALGQENAQLQEQTADSGGKVKLLRNEVAFNQQLLDTLQSVQKIRAVVKEADAALGKDAISDVVSALQDAREQLESLGNFQSTEAASALKENVSELTKRLEDSLDHHWEQLIVVDPTKSAITINAKSGEATFNTVGPGLASLDLLKPKVLSFWKVLDSLVLGPRLARKDGKPLSILIENNTISLHESPTNGSMKQLFADIGSLRAFLGVHLPSQINFGLNTMMMPSIIPRLIAGPLPASVPSDLGGLSSFDDTLKEVTRFVEELNATGWKDTKQLSDWVASAPKVWSSARQAESLNSMRLLLTRGLGNPRSVERVEMQTIVEHTHSLEKNGGGDDDWDATWDEDDQPAADTPSHSSAAEDPVEDEGNDGNAWGWEDDGEHNEETSEGRPQDNDEDDGEAWGWGDEDKQAPLSAAQQSRPNQSNGEPAPIAPVERTVTLRESYYITALPESILELVIMIVEDADTLSRSPNNPVAPAAPKLYELVGALLAMYRAVAPDAYSRHDSGSMFLYNDTQYLAEQLRLFADHHAGRNSESSLAIQSDLAALQIFGKQAYSREMESQRTILKDLLDGANGFSECAVQPQASQCDLAVTSVIERIQEINAQWKSVLSPSALLQSSGSLLNTVINKLIVDIEDMGDIEESTSKALVNYCTSIESLEGLFLPPQQSGANDEGQSVPLTAGYVSNWLKFQYLSSILDSSLADIKYLWTEGNLSLEFGADEVIDLVEALFADSPRRREAIGEIRRSAR